MGSSSHLRTIGSGTVVTLGLVATGVRYLRLVVLSDGTPLGVRLVSHRCSRRSLTCTSLMITRLALGKGRCVCAACVQCGQLQYPTDLVVGRLSRRRWDGLAWLSAAVIAAAMIVMVLLLQGRSWYHGVIALGAVISPSVMMGVERGNLDLLILALVGSAALIYEERRSDAHSGPLRSRPWRRVEAISNVLRLACGSL